MRKLSVAEINRRASNIHQLTTAFGVSTKGARYLVSKKNLTPSKVKCRVVRMRKANVPLQGLVWKLSLTEPKLQALIARFRTKHKLTENQRRLLNFLREKGVSEQAAIGLVKRPKGRQSTLASMKQKIAFFESIKLDKRVYGAERISPRYYEVALSEPLRSLKKGIKRRVLEPLAKDFAVKTLNQRFPQWRSMVDLRRKVSPAKILRKVEAARSQGIMPTSAVLTGYSPKTIAEMGARPRHSLDERAIRAHVKGAYGLESTPEHNIARARVLNAVIARPHLAIKRSWLLNNLRSELGTPKEVFTRVVEELTDLGVLSSRDGYLTISTWFRTGTSGPAEHKMAVERRILSHQLGWQRRKQRELAM